MKQAVKIYCWQIILQTDGNSLIYAHIRGSQINSSHSKKVLDIAESIVEISVRLAKPEREKIMKISHHYYIKSVGCPQDTLMRQGISQSLTE